MLSNRRKWSLKRLPRAEEEVRLFETRLMALPPLERVPLPEAEEVLILGGSSGLAEKVTQALGDLGYSNVKRIADPVLPEDSSTEADRINQPLSNGGRSRFLEKNLRALLGLRRNF